MINEPNANMNCLSTHKVALNLDSDNDDCYTSISQCPVNPLSLIPNVIINDISLPPVQMLTYDGFWKEQQNEEITEVTSSVGTFSAETTSKHPITFTKWYPVISDFDLQIAGVTLNGCMDSRTVRKRIARYIFYDNSETACSLVGPMSLSDGQPKFIQQKFLYGIPEDWTTIRLLWIQYKKENSPYDFIWSAKTNLDSESIDSDVSVNLNTITDINHTELINIGQPPVFSTPQNSTNCFYNITEISKINDTDLAGNFRQKLLQNCTRNRSVKKSYSTALLKKKLRKYQTMLKVSLMRECSTLESLDHIREFFSIQEETQHNFLISNHATSQCETTSKLQNVSQKNVNQNMYLPVSHKSNHRLQSTFSNETIKSHQCNNFINVPSTLQFQKHDVSNLQITKENDFGLENAKNSSSTSQNKASKPISLTSSNMSVLRFTSSTPEDKINLLKTVDVVSKLQNDVQPNDNEGNNEMVQRVLFTTINNEDSQNYVASKVFNNHHASKPLHKNKIGNCNEYKAVETKLDESVDSNALIEDVETYPNNSNSVVISLYKTSQINKPSTSKSSPSVTNNMSYFPRPRINLFENIMESDSDESFIGRRKVQNESSENDSIFMCKESDNTNKQRLKTMCSESIVARDGQIKEKTKSNVGKDTLQNCQALESHIDEQNENASLFSSEDNIFAPSLKSLTSNEKQNNKQVITKNLKKKKSSEHVEFDKNFNLHQDTKIVTQKAMRRNASNSIITDKSVYNIGERRAVKRFQIECSSSDSEDMEYSNQGVIADIVVHTVPNMFDSETSNKQLEKRKQKIGPDESIGSLTKIQAKICDNTKDNKRNRSQSKTSSKERMENFKIYKEAEIETNNTFKYGGDTKIAIPQKKTNNSVKRSPKKNDTKQTNQEKSHDENYDSYNICNNKMSQETKQFPISDKNSNNLKKSAQENNSLQIKYSVFSKKILDFDQSEVYSSRKRRVRCTRLPFWTGSRLKTVGDETIIINDSMTNLDHKNFQGQKLLLTRQNVSSVGEKYMKTPLKSPIRQLENTLSNLTSSNDCGTENIINAKLKSKIENLNPINHNEEEMNVTDENNSRRTRQTKNKSIVSHKKIRKNPPPNRNKIPSDFLNDNTVELIKHNVEDISKEYPELKNGVIYLCKENIKYRNSVDMNKEKFKNELTLSSYRKTLKKSKNEPFTLSFTKSKENMPEHVQESEMKTLKLTKCRRSKSTIEQNKLINNCNNEQGQLIRNMREGDVTDFTKDIFNAVHTPKLNIKQHELVTNNSEINQLMIATGRNVGKRPTANVAKQLKFTRVKDNAENISDSSDIENNGHLDTLERFDRLEKSIDKVTRKYDKCPLHVKSSKLRKDVNSKSREQKLQEGNDKFPLLNSPKFKESNKITKLCTTEENKTNASKDISNISLVKAINESKTASFQSSKFLSRKSNENNFENDSNIEIVDYTKPSCGEAQKMIESNKLLKVSLDYMENVDSGVEIITNCGDEILEITPSKLQKKKKKKIQCESENFKTEIAYTNAITKDSSINFNKQKSTTIDYQNISVDTTNNRANIVSNCKYKVDFDEQKEKKERKSRTKRHQEIAKKQSKKLCNISARSNSRISYITDAGSNLNSSSLNTTISCRDRTRISTLPFWNGSRILTSDDGVKIIMATSVSADSKNRSNFETHESFKLQHKSVIKQPPNFNLPKPPTPQPKQLINQNVCPKINISNVIENSFQNTSELSNHSARQRGIYSDINKDKRKKSRKANKKNKKTGNENSDERSANLVNSSATRPNEKRNSETEDQKLSKDKSFTKKSCKFAVKELAKKIQNKQVTHKMKLRKKREHNELKDSLVFSKIKGHDISKRKPKRSKTEDKNNEQGGISDNFVKTQTVENDTNKILTDKRKVKEIVKRTKVHKGSKINPKETIYDVKECAQNAILDGLTRTNIISKPDEKVCKNYTNKTCLSVENNRVPKRSRRKSTEIISDVKKSEQNVTPDSSIKTSTIFKSAENVYENYTKKNCVVIIKPLPDDIIKHLMKRRSNTVKGKSPGSKINSANISKIPPLLKKSRKRKHCVENLMNDLQQMSIIRPKMERTTKGHPLITPNMATISINNATKKSGKRKLYSEAAWLNSEEFQQSVVENEKSVPHNFCIQVEENNLQDDFDDEISEVCAFVKNNTLI